MPLRSITFLLYFCGSSAGAFAYPMVGVLCYIVLYHIYPQTTWWGKALEPLGIRYAFVCGLCLCVGTILNINRLKFGRQVMHPLEWGILITFLAMLLSIATGVSYDYKTDFLIDKMMKVFLFALVMAHVVVTRKRMWHLVLVLTLLTLYLGHEAKNAPLSAFTHNRLDGIGGPDFRESAGLAIHLLALLPFVAITFLQRQLWLKALAFLATGYGINAFLLCRARSAFIAAIVAGIFALWYVPRKYRRWVVFMLVCGAIGGATLSDKWFRNRMETIFSSAEERDTSAASRLVIWSAAWEMVKDHPLGVGIGQFAEHIGEYATDEHDDVQKRDAHNTFVLCAGETGILGIGAFLASIAIAWGTLTRTDRRIRKALPGDTAQFLRLFVFANRLSLIVYATASLFVSRFYTEGLWMLLVLPVCASRAVENEVRAQARASIAIHSELREKLKEYLEPELDPGWGGITV